MLFIAIGLYSYGVYRVLRMSRKATVPSGTAAAIAALSANGIGMLMGVTARAWMAPLVAVAAAVASSKAFAQSDDVQRDSDQERAAFQAGVSLAGLAVVEALMALVGLFVWMLNRP
jgi:hypothetical protein